MKKINKIYAVLTVEKGGVEEVILGFPFKDRVVPLIASNKTLFRQYVELAKLMRTHNKVLKIKLAKFKREK